MAPESHIQITLCILSINIESVFRKRAGSGLTDWYFVTSLGKGFAKYICNFLIANPSSGYQISFVAFLEFESSFIVRFCQILFCKLAVALEIVSDTPTRTSISAWTHSLGKVLDFVELRKSRQML